MEARLIATAGPLKGTVFSLSEQETYIGRNPDNLAWIHDPNRPTNRSVSRRHCLIRTFKMLVPLYADFDGKIVRVGSAPISGNSSTPEFAVLLPKRPKRVMLCAYEDVLCTIRER